MSPLHAFGAFTPCLSVLNPVSFQPAVTNCRLISHASRAGCLRPGLGCIMTHKLCLVNARRACSYFIIFLEWHSLSQGSTLWPTLTLVTSQESHIVSHWDWDLNTWILGICEQPVGGSCFSNRTLDFCSLLSWSHSHAVIYFIYHREGSRREHSDVIPDQSRQHASETRV